jgi:hypothetical protein
MGAMEAAQTSIRAFSKRPQALAGVIMVVKETGEYGLAHNTAHMPFAMLNDDGSITAGIRAPTFIKTMDRSINPSL